MIHRSLHRMHTLKHCLLLSLLLLAAARQASPQTAGSDPPIGQKVAHQVRKPGNSRSAAARAQKVPPGLCFEPGIGWRRDFPEQPNWRATAPPLTDQINGSTSVQESPSNADRPFSDLSLRKKQKQSTECAGISTKREARTLLSPGSTRPHTSPSLRAPSPYPVRGGSAWGKGTPSFMPPRYFLAGN